MPWTVSDEKRFLADTAMRIDQNKEPMAVARHGRGEVFIVRYLEALDKRVLDFDRGPLSEVDRAILERHCRQLLNERLKIGDPS